MSDASTSMSDAATAVDKYSDSVSTSDSFKFSPPSAKRANIQNRQDLTNLTLMSKCFDVSHRAGAIIFAESAILKEFGMIDDKTLTNVQD